MIITYNNHTYSIEEQRVNNHLVDFFITIDNVFSDRFSLTEKHYLEKEKWINSYIQQTSKDIKNNYIRLQ